MRLFLEGSLNRGELAEGGQNAAEHPMKAMLLFLVVAPLSLSAWNVARADEVFLPQIHHASAAALKNISIVNSSTSSAIAVPVKFEAPSKAAAGGAISNEQANTAQLTQVGVNNLATIGQFGTGNLALLSQQGHGNVAVVTQSSRPR
jgi:hypothetical protein